MAEEKNNTQGKTLRGTIVSLKSMDTATVAVTRYVEHPKYKKFLKKTKKYQVHAPGTEKQVGDVVTIRETKPISKTKHFILVEQ